MVDENLKNKAIEEITKFLDEKSKSIEEHNQKIVDLISQWILDYVHFLKREGTKKNKDYRRYDRGSIIKVNLGFRIDSEFGGLHYAVVLNKKDTIKNPVLTVIPLTSIKSDEQIRNLHSNNINLGHEVMNHILEKLNLNLEKTQTKYEDIKELLEKLNTQDELPDRKEIKRYKERLLKLQEEMNIILSHTKKAEKMKAGGIAIINQIVTISKMRIYDPKNKSDFLNGIRLDNSTMDKIDAKIKELYTKT